MDYGNSMKNNLIWHDAGTKYFDASYNIDPENKNASFSILSKYVKAGTTVLDVGCNDGKWGRLLKGKQCVCYGIDISPEAIEFLSTQKTYKKVAVCDIGNPDSLSTLKQWRDSFDYIGCFDVLEHIADPTSALIHLCSLIKTEGKILVSIPNIGNADIFLNLMRGKFNYSSTGILDNTHNKFFTKGSFAEWIDDINGLQTDFKLECEYVGGTFGYTGFLEHIRKKYPKTHSIIQMNPQFNVIQLLFVLTKKSSNYVSLKLTELLNEPYYDAIFPLLESNIESDSNTVMLLRNNNISDNERGDYLERIDKMENQLKKDQEALKQVEQENKQLSKLLDEVNHQWENAALELEKANNNWSECAKKLDGANKGWSECAQRLDEANKEWSECAQRLDEANREWSLCAQRLDSANKEWNECARKQEAANKGWTFCDEQLNAVRHQLIQCKNSLELATRERENCRIELKEKCVEVNNQIEKAIQLEDENEKKDRQIIELQARIQTIKQLLEEEKELYKNICSQYDAMKYGYESNKKRGKQK